MSNLNPVRINPSKKPGNQAMEFARAAMLDKLKQEPGTPQLIGQAPHVPPGPPGPDAGGQGKTGLQTLKTAVAKRR